MRSCLRSVLAALLLTLLPPALARFDPFAARAGAQQSPEPAKQAHESDEFPRLDDALESLKREPVLLVSEGLEPLVDPAALRARLAGLLGRPVVSLADADAGAALGSLWVARNQGFIILRLSMQGVDLWQRIPARSLSGDAAGAIANAVIDMLWSDRIARVGGSEVLDPFCPPGLVCADANQPAQRVYALRRAPEPPVLDPWDTPQPRYSLLESRAYWTRGDPWGESAGIAGPVEHAPATQSPVQVDPPGPAHARARDKWALGALAGGGVHEAGGFVRYEVNALRRFPRFDVGLAFVGARGQPDPAHSARRAVVALAQRRYVMDGLEIDLGAGFGTFIASSEGQAADVHPYLRGVGIFALTLGRLNDLIAQSEIGTTFTKAGDAGAFEYALAIGVRQRL